MKKSIFTIITIIAFCGLSYSQTMYQTIKGKVYDKVTHQPLPLSTVMVLHSTPLIGTSTDNDGNFVLEDVPIGRRDIQISIIGYESFVVNELLVSTGRDLFLDIALKQKTTSIEEVVVKLRKDAPLNTMATLSSRQFTVEETQRYAGGMDDPARLVSSFAGVVNPSVSSNGISVRGNNSEGLLWRIEGVEVPNPNHFANLTVVGGGLLTALSNQMMGNSDFFTGAFPAEYGNVISGVFDIKLNTGNYLKREYTFKAGLLGLDFATQGPFLNGKESSYIVNYRYSTTGLVSEILPEDSGVIEYQDISFKTNFPTKRAGVFSLWSIAAKDGQEMVAADSVEWESNFDRDNSKTSLYMFAAGLSHKIRINYSTFLNTSISASGNGITHEEKRLDNNLVPRPHSNIDNNTWRYTIQSNIYHHFNSKHSNRTGFYYSHIGYDIDIKESLKEGTLPVLTAKEKGQSDLLQLYTQSRINLLPQIILNLGFHGQYFMLNKNYSLEPRLGIKYIVDKKHAFAFAYGLHSRIENLPVYFVDNNGSKPNKELELMKSAHYVLSYSLKLNEHIRMRIEPYYQYLTNIPVSPNSYLSTINIENDIFFNDVMVSKGKGRNIGIDLSLERFLSKGFYYLLTASLFDSKYKDADGIERNTRFNKNYVFNILVGKEWLVGKEKNNLFSINLRLNYMGGNRKESIDIENSIITKDIVYSETDGNIAFEKSYRDMPVFSFTFSYRKNKPKYSSVWSLQLLNATGTKEYVEDFYNIKTGGIDTRFDGIIVPNISYKIEF